MNLADDLARKGRSDEAMVHYEEAIRLQPNYADAYYNRGSVLFAKGRTDEAIADWEKTLQIQPNDADAHTGLGNALLRKGSLHEAIAQYEKALGLAPEDPHSGALGCPGYWRQLLMPQSATAPVVDRICPGSITAFRR